MKHVLFTAFVFLAINIKAQPSVDWAWGNAVGGQADDISYCGAADNSGNYYVGGTFRGMADFNPDTSTAFHLTSSGVTDAFILKSRPNGIVDWVHSFGGLGNDELNALGTDNSGNVIAAGVFNGSADFDPDPVISYTMTCASGSELFVLKLNPSGGFMWAVQIDAAITASGKYMAVDGSGNIYIKGTFFGTVDFDPGPGVYNLSASTGDIFVLKLDAQGNFAWASNFDNISIFSIGTEKNATGNLYITGKFMGSADFDPGTAVFTLTTTSLSDMFLLKLDSAGDFAWAKVFAGTGNGDYGHGVIPDQSGNIYMTGWISDSTDFDAGAGVSYLIPQTTTAFFICKLTGSGDLIWARNAGGSGYSFAEDITIDHWNNDDIYIAGSFIFTVDFDADPLINHDETASGINDIFVMKYDSAGQFHWVRTMGGAGTDFGYSVSVAPDKVVYVAGYFSSTSMLYTGGNVFNASVQQSDDVFYARIDTGIVISNISNFNYQSNLYIYPNPCNNHVTLKKNPDHNTVSEIVITDVNGKIIYKGAMNDFLVVETGNLDSGLYLVREINPAYINSFRLVVLH